ncbi:MAG: hypothetical protein ACM4D3_08635 [Candidatus Sericytochromatia bacterium]
MLNDSDGHADKRTRAVLTQQFADHGQVVIEVPFDPHLRPGGVIDVANQMSPKTRRGFYEIAAAIVEHFVQARNRYGVQTAVMASPRRTSCAPRSPAMSPWRG